jgi:hypothetical protein
MSIYTVQPGDTPMRITHKLLGNPSRMGELIRSNAHKPTIGFGRTVTFRDLAVGERLTIPPRWIGVSGPQQVVHPRDLNEGTEIGDDGGSEPILGLGKKTCCRGCASGGSCEGTCPSKTQPPCSEPKAPPSVPGSTSFPVGFGQTSPPAVTTSTVASAISGWVVPLAVGAVSIAAGFGLAYVISHK